MNDTVIGAIIGISIFIVFCMIWTKVANRYGIETFTSGKTPTDSAKKIKDTNSHLDDTLNILKFRSSYEDIIVELETWATNSQLNILASGVIGVDTLTNSMKSVHDFNELKLFKTNLNDLINVLDLK
jgi:hypothetical protein